jgi:hypothetical protein
MLDYEPNRIWLSVHACKIVAAQLTHALQLSAGTRHEMLPLEAQFHAATDCADLFKRQGAEEGLVPVVYQSLQREVSENNHEPAAQSMRDSLHDIAACDASENAAFA